MKIRAQIAMVLNLDKCIGCHTCSVTCKNVWTNREGMEYAWFNNVETKPGIGYPKDWENQEPLERRLDPQEERQDRAEDRLQVAGARQHLRQSRPAGDRRLLRALHLRLRASAEGAGARGLPDRPPALADHRRADGEDRVGPELGGNSRRRIRQALARMPISKASRRRSTASSKTPS
jgi:ferredoxin